MLSHSFEDLAQAFRVLMESEWSFRRLLNIDRAEAIGNLESGLNTQLNAFHNLYDNMSHNQIPPDWYLIPQLLTILIIRNARHHNKANRIRTLYNCHRQLIANPTHSKNYFYVKFPSLSESEGHGFFNVPISWGDLDLMLSLPRQESRLKPEARNRVRDYLNADKFEAEAISRGFTKADIFINYIPLSMNAAITLFPYINSHVSPLEDSIEAEAFLSLFEHTEQASTHAHGYEVLPFSFPK